MRVKNKPNVQSLNHLSMQEIFSKTIEAIEFAMQLAYSIKIGKLSDNDMQRKIYSN